MYYRSDHSINKSLLPDHPGSKGLSNEVCSRTLWHDRRSQGQSLRAASVTDWPTSNSTWELPKVGKCRCECLEKYEACKCLQLLTIQQAFKNSSRVASFCAEAHAWGILGGVWTDSNNLIWCFDIIDTNLQFIFATLIVINSDFFKNIRKNKGFRKNPYPTRSKPVLYPCQPII